MKKLAFIIIGFTISAFVQAQVCTPYWSDTSYGIHPDTIENLPIAYVNVPYDVVIQFKVPATATYNNLPITIDHVVLDSVGGLSAVPTSVPFYFNCNPSTCSFKHDSVGCVRIQGTPTTVGTYDLVINTRVFINNIIFSPFPTPGYKLVVKDNVGIPAISKTVFDVSQNLPNPVINFTDVYVNLERAENISLRISNLVGTEIYRENIVGNKGINTVSIDASHFAQGIYFYSVSNGAQSITKRMVVERK
ncbi:MAG: T9SS type A sorting domain-containing protein [Chitinophagales bacterium]|nr:T9SS type A sorting domain-containing protein [Chitinophagales bacterium]